MIARFLYHLHWKLTDAENAAYNAGAHEISERLQAITDEVERMIIEEVRKSADDDKAP